MCIAGFFLEFEDTFEFDAIGPYLNDPKYTHISFWVKALKPKQIIELKLENLGEDPKITNSVYLRIDTTKWIYKEVNLNAFRSYNSNNNVDLSALVCI